MKAIEQQTGANLNMCGQKEDLQRDLLIAGTKNAVKAAQEELKILVTNY